MSSGCLNLYFWVLQFILLHVWTYTLCVWTYIFGCLDLYFGCLDLYFRRLDLYLWCLDLYCGRLDLFFGYLNLYFGCPHGRTGGQTDGRGQACGQPGRVTENIWGRINFGNMHLEEHYYCIYFGIQTLRCFYKKDARRKMMNFGGGFAPRSLIWDRFRPEK